jgi:SAM-dependent methyltransferase
MNTLRGPEDKIAAEANIKLYDADATEKYIEGAPHVKHASVRSLYDKLVGQAYSYAERYQRPPRVLDLGAGEGSATLSFLELGARVTAVDISKSQLDGLAKKCRRYAGNLEIMCLDVNEACAKITERYDIVVTNAFLHHVPDYLNLVQAADRLLSSHGLFFSFQDPLKYKTVRPIDKVFSNVAYFFWRISQGDVFGGLQRRWRRARGIYSAESKYDNAEYHVVRGGVDEEAIKAALEKNGHECAITKYFSTQSGTFQAIGQFLGIRNTFAIMARKRAMGEKNE